MDAVAESVERRSKMNAREMLEKVQVLKEQCLLNGFEKTPDIESFFSEYWMQILDMLDDALYAYTQEDYERRRT